jgi:hypothetical protein
MLKIPLKCLPAGVIQAILHPDPLAGEDIQIEDDGGNLLAAIIPGDAYRFFLQKVEQREDEIDAKVVENYDPNAKILDDFMKELDNEQ